MVKININNNTQKPIEYLFNLAGSDTYTRKLVISLVICLNSFSSYVPFDFTFKAIGVLLESKITF